MAKLSLTVYCEDMGPGDGNLPIVKVDGEAITYQDGETIKKEYDTDKDVSFETELLGDKYIFIGYEGYVESTNKNETISVPLNSEKKITLRLELKTKEVIPVGNEYIIHTPSELRWIAEISKNETFINKTVKLENDINLRNYPFDGIGERLNINAGRFEGTFDGQGNEVSGLNINNTTGSTALYTGFISRLGNWNSSGACTVKNLGLSGTVRNDNTDIPYYTRSGTGGIVGHLFGNSIIENCYNAADVTSIVGAVGGIVGIIDSGTDFVGSKVRISNVYNTGKITRNNNDIYGSTVAGGIVGRGSLSVANVYSIGGIFFTTIGIDPVVTVGGIMGCYEDNEFFYSTNFYFLSTANINNNINDFGTNYFGTNASDNYNPKPGMGVNKFSSLVNFPDFDPVVWKIKAVKEINGVSRRPVLIGVGEGRD